MGLRSSCHSLGQLALALQRGHELNVIGLEEAVCSHTVWQVIDEDDK